MMPTFAAFLMSLILGLSPFWPMGQNPMPGDPFIIVNKTDHELSFFTHDQLVMQVPVATGKSEGLTPEGLFNIIIKAKNPYYHKKNNPGGDPRNPLGELWIGFDAEGSDGRIYWIHGTNQPSSIGKNLTSGAIRMYRTDLEMLYDQVPIGTKILLTKSDRSARDLAIEHGALSAD